MGLTPETVDRLLLSRSLISHLRFKPAEDRFAVAAHILASHDAAELALASICSERGVVVPDNRALGLPDYLGKLKEHVHPARDVRAKDYFTKLNRVRVDLKHHGITPDKDQWGGVAETVFLYVSEWCKTYLKADYAGLDAADLVGVLEIREILLEARLCLRREQFKACLEKLAEAITASSLVLIPIGVHVPVGHADADTAVALSAYGIDPGRYLSLQRLLPSNSKLFSASLFEAVWRKREYGHQANWTRENAEFAYEETINVLTRLQQAKPYPTPYRFNDVFKDVITIKSDAPTVMVMQWALGEWLPAADSPKFGAGDRIECRAAGLWSDGFPSSEQVEDSDQDPDNAPKVMATRLHRCDRLKSDLSSFCIIFDRNDVDLTQEPWDWLEDSDGVPTE
jgi:hypothetical protein